MTILIVEIGVGFVSQDNALSPVVRWATSHTFSHSQETENPNSFVLLELEFSRYPLGDLNPCYRTENPVSWAD